MSKNITTESKSYSNKFNIETSKDIGVHLKEYKGNLTSRECGQLVKKMVEEYERNL